MANRYWVGGAGTWDESSTSHWSASSGGATGASVPTVSDAVFFNANSGSGTVTVTPSSYISLYCASLDFTGFVGTFDSADAGGNFTFFVYGNVTLSSGGTYYVSAGSGYFYGHGFGVVMVGTGTFTSVGKTINILYIGDGSTPTTTTLGDNLSIQPGSGSGMVGTFQVNNGTFNANNFNIQTQDFSAFDPGAGNSITINMGSGTWQLWDDGTGFGWNINFGIPVTGGTLTINPGTSTIQMGGTTSSPGPVFNGIGYTYYNLTITGKVQRIAGNNTFNTIAGNYIAGTRTISFVAGSTQTVSNFTVSGSSGSLWTLNSAITGTRWNLSKASGTVSVDYLSIRDSNATGGATWYAGANSTDGGNNSGWTFTAPPSPSGPVAIGTGITIGGGITIG